MLSPPKRKTLLKTGTNPTIRANLDKIASKEAKRDKKEQQRENKEEMEKLSQENKDNAKMIVDQLNKMTLTIIEQLKQGFGTTQGTTENNKEEENPKEHEDHIIVTMSQTQDEQITDQQRYRQERLYQKTTFKERKTKSQSIKTTT